MHTRVRGVSDVLIAVEVAPFRAVLLPVIAIQVALFPTVSLPVTCTCI